MPQLVVCPILMIFIQSYLEIDGETRTISDYDGSMIFTISRAFTNSSGNYAYEIKSATVKINGTISATHKIISENTTGMII